jgi:hypothetical protein
MIGFVEGGCHSIDRIDTGSSPCFGVRQQWAETVTQV